jgi:hypothetical protein
LSSNLSPLIELQHLDLRLAELREQRRKIPERLATAEAPLKEGTQLLQNAMATMEGLVKERRSNEKDLEVHEAQTEKLKARLSEIKTNKEYQAHLFEIEIANKKRREIEDKILDLMEQIEGTQGAFKEMQAKVGEAERVFLAEKQTVDALALQLDREMSELEQKQSEWAARVDRALLDRYTKLKGARKEQALAAIKDGTCCGCRLQVPPQLVAQVKRADDLYTCPYCQRILYWESPAVDATQSAPTLEETA